MPPLAGSEHCWTHDPENAEAAAEARRLGGLRRRREGTVSGAYEFHGLTTVEQIRRLLDIAALDTLGLENSLGRARTLIAVAQAAGRLLEVGELEERLAILEAAVLARGLAAHSPFDQGSDDRGGPFHLPGGGSE